MKKIVIGIFCLFGLRSMFAQQSEWNSVRILLEMQKLQSTTTVLYIAAHPDDENTRLITYLANDVKARTGYLSLTRGDGGQNLIGEEQGALLGVIRTQELLAARATDGGEQFFTRAVDFGYSKSADETFTMWDHDSLLADVVWVIRNFRPDIIITRFPPDERAGHGQHTASAMLAEEAFNAAGDPNRFPGQLIYVQPWQPTRLFWNNSTWWDKQINEKIANGNPDLLAMNIGGYNTLLGKSYGEIAADSRTHHKSQGFGATPSMGDQTEYLERKYGSAVANGNMFSGIATDWSRYRQGSEINDKIQKMIDAFDPLDPSASVPALLNIYAALTEIPDDEMIRYKRNCVQEIVAACMGLWLEPVALQPIVAGGDSINIVSTCIKRSNYPITLESVQCMGNTIKVGEILPKNVLQLDTIDIKTPKYRFTSPYWLASPYNGMYVIREQLMIGRPESLPVISFLFTVKIDKFTFTYERQAVYKETDAVKGEIVTQLAVVPQVITKTDATNYMFTSSAPQTIHVTAHKYAAKAEATIYLDLPAGWESKPASYNIQADDPENLQFDFEVHPGANAKTEGICTVMLKRQDNFPAKTLQVVDYEHIPKQYVLTDCTAKLTRIQTTIPTFPVAYIEGAGDNVYESLKGLGLNITSVEPASITADLLKQYKVVVIGIRAYNVSKEMADVQPILMDYVKNGGLVIMQYSTNWDNYATSWGPYPFSITRGRVTDEHTPVTFALPAHHVLNTPNKITQDDFSGWIQERGIYFAGNVAPEYVAPLSMADPDEDPSTGALIIADYGKGAFMYTGLVFFRELPAGVPGAYRLFINMLSYTPEAH